MTVLWHNKSRLCHCWYAHRSSRLDVLRVQEKPLLPKPTKKLLLQLCGGSKQRYAEMRDCGLADSELGEVRKLSQTMHAMSSLPSGLPPKECREPLEAAFVAAASHPTADLKTRSQVLWAEFSS